MSKSLSPKYQFLKEAKEAGILVPETLFLSQEKLKDKTYESQVQSFLGRQKDQKFIIRSCIIGEDGAAVSYAGHFVSSGKLSAEDVLPSIQKLFQENKKIQKKICPEGSTNLMIQQYIEQKQGGVCFAPWQHFYHHAFVESSSEGASAVVEGRGTKSRVVDLRNPEKEETSIASVVQKLCKTFKGPLDIEWGMGEDNQLYIFQVRPVTAPLGGIQSASDDAMGEQKETLEKIHTGEWRISALSESLGTLSPLSFSLFKNLYAKSQNFFQEVGLTAENADFIARVPSGQMYINLEAEKNYWSPKGMTGSFKINAKKTHFKREIQDFIERQGPMEAFHSKKLQQYFRCWMLASMYGVMEGEKLSFWGRAGEYELSFPRKVMFPQKSEIKTWNDLRICLKQLFVYQIGLLKKDLCPEDMFGAFDKDWNVLPADYKYDPKSLLVYPQSFSKSQATKHTVVVKGSGAHDLEVIFQPSLFKGPLPENKVIVAPYFDNRWVEQIPRLKGVILEQGGMLSHSAIVARENNIPYIINVENAVKIYKKESQIDLSQL